MPLVNAVSLLVSLVAVTPSPGPTLAREDTMHTEVPEVLVRAPRVTLDEILDRVARGEARRDSAIRDQAFTATLRVVRAARGDQPAAVVEERVYRIYRKKPDHVRTVLLREWKAKPDKRATFRVDFSSGTSEEIVNFAFRPEARREFRYHILGRDLRGDHLVYRIAFEPRSPLDPSDPSGIVWVDTNDFVIVRQEVSFKRSPVPILIRGIDRMVIERQRSDGHWVLSRVLMRAESTIPVPRLGRAFDLTLHYDKYAINAGMPDSLFGASAAGR
jgi:hypothetical protein